MYREEAYWQNKNHLKSEITSYLWDGNHVLMEFDGKGVSPLAEYYLGNGQIIAKKMFGLHGRKQPGNDNLIRTRGGLLYYHYDSLGSVTALTDRQGEVIDRYYYDVFGQPLAGIYGPYNSYGFTGKEYDQKTGQYYFPARWLNPTVGRWMTQDPFRGWTSDPASMHRYLYVNQNPTKCVDPLGYQCTVLQPELTVAGVVAAYVIATYDSTTKVVNAICDWAVDAWDGIVNSNTPEKTEDSTKNGKGLKPLPSAEELQHMPLDEFNPDDYGLIKNKKQRRSNRPNLWSSR